MKMELTEKEFYKLNRKEQIKELNKLGIKPETGLNEKDLYILYKEYFESNKEEKVIVEEQPIELEPVTITETEIEKPLHISCPNCNNIDDFIKVNEDRNEYKCRKCEKGYSGYPPPSYPERKI